MDNCVICDDPETQNHHLFPINLGGPVDGPQIKLCPTCHNKCHYCAMRLYRGVALQEDENWLRLAAPIIHRIVRAMWESEGRSLDNAPARIILVINKRMLRRIHRQKQDRGFSSLQAYIMKLISLDLPPG